VKRYRLTQHDKQRYEPREAIILPLMDKVTQHTTRQARMQGSHFW